MLDSDAICGVPVYLAILLFALMFVLDAICGVPEHLAVLLFAFDA